MAPDDNPESDAKTDKKPATAAAETKKSKPEVKPTGREHWGEGGRYRIREDGKRVKVSDNY